MTFGSFFIADYHKIESGYQYRKAPPCPSFAKRLRHLSKDKKERYPLTQSPTLSAFPSIRLMPLIQRLDVTENQISSDDTDVIIDERANTGLYEDELEYD